MKTQEEHTVARIEEEHTVARIENPPRLKRRAMVSATANLIWCA